MVRRLRVDRELHGNGHDRNIPETHLYNHRKTDDCTAVYMDTSLTNFYYNTDFNGNRTSTARSVLTLRTAFLYGLCFFVIKKLINIYNICLYDNIVEFQVLYVQLIPAERGRRRG